MVKLKEHQQWWEKNIGTTLRGIKIPDELGWRDYMGNSQNQDRKIMRDRIDRSWKTLLDVGCGGCPDHQGLIQDGFDLEYTGVEITPKLVDYWKERGINIIQADCEDLPFEDSSFDVVTGRHIIEHLPGFENPLKEWIRVAKHKILLLFFQGPIGPGGIFTDSYGNFLDNDGKFSKATKSNISCDPNDFHCYSNWYHKKEIEDFLSEQTKVESFEFLGTAPTSTSMLEIIIKEIKNED